MMSLLKTSIAVVPPPMPSFGFPSPPPSDFPSPFLSHPSSTSVFCCSNGALPRISSLNDKNPSRPLNSSVGKLQSLLYPEIIKPGETPIALSRCYECEKGLVTCATCSGSGLYVDSILESQGIIVKVTCLGCGGSGNILCSACGGRGHL